ncbi:hypothetical protein ACNHKD_11100 [Methylocystis sp. JAN1]|uniref:hypothetical protein n=1 Tax=Methylocystis sp. JAN1 TaxID=3397211 RepID=UPI003FA2A3AD
MGEKKDIRSRISRIVERMRGAPPYVAVPTGLGFVLGGTVLAPLPVFGVWMVPLGLAILAPHWPGAERLSRRLHWQRLKFLRWSIRHGFVRVKRAERKGDERAPDAEG